VSAGALIENRAQRLNGQAKLDGSSLEITGASGRTARMVLPENWDLFDFHHALPGRARGDQRERLIAEIARDAAPDPGDRGDADLRDALTEPGALPVEGEVQAKTLAAVMRDHYWISPERTGRATQQRFAFPFHAAIPANFKPPGRYKMYRSNILLFLCWDGQEIDPRPVEALCELLSDRTDFTLLDRILVDLATGSAGSPAVEEIHASDLLSSEQASNVRGFLSGGAFNQPALDRFRQDFLAALQMSLPRHDRVEAAILTLSLHIALYYYEIAFLLGTGLDAVTRAAAKMPEEESEFRGRLRFRVGTAGDRPVRRADACASAWRELDDRYLISLTPNIVTANILHSCWSAAGGASQAADPHALAREMRRDPALAELLDLAAGALAVIYADRAASASAPELQRLAESTEPGTYLLNSVVHSNLRKSLHYRSRAVVSQLVRRPFGGNLIRTRGNVIFFELDEDLLFYLVKFALVRGGQRELPFHQFLEELSVYGLSPQDLAERTELAAALERLGMLHRYSDAGEAMYVRHPL
jgi:hypothetical protein